MTPRQRVCAAMELGTPDQVPVQCQMATGHILLNTGVDPVAYATDTRTYGRALAQMRERYDFDGILMHKPGREPGWLDACEKRATVRGWDFVFPEGCTVRVQGDDDPIFLPAPGFRWPDVNEINIDEPLATFVGGYRKWLEFKATHGYTRVEDIPEWWYGCIDYLREKLGDKFSLHGETRAPFDHVLALLSVENLMMALITDRSKIHQLMEWSTRIATTWAVAQIRRGCDAVKVSSPWVGAGFISVGDYRELVVPYEKKLAEAVRAEGGFVYTHTCGRITDRLENMIATGINGIECLDPPPLGNVELDDAIRRTKGKIFIKGNVDSVNTLLNKDIDGVRRDVRQVVETAAPGGGYICSTACSIAPHVKPDHIKTMVEVTREYKY